ncbi:MAG: Crp/Fnr family transcriptional regulator [Kofleriaceae bacterium]
MSVLDALRSSTSASATLPAGPPPLPADVERRGKSEKLAAILRASHFFEECAAGSPRAMELLVTASRLRELRAGDSLWREGEVATRFHVIGHGLVAVRRSLASGAEVILAIFGARESLGDTAALEGATYPADAVVLSATASVVSVDAAVVRACCAQHPLVAEALAQALCRHAAVLRKKVEILAAGSVRARLAHLFVHLAERFGATRGDGTVAVPVALPRTMIASLVSARVETVIRALRPWERSGLVVTRKDGFVVQDPAVLAAYVARG